MNLEVARRFIALFGLLLALVALYVDRTWFTWVAIGVLAVSFGMRFLTRRRPPEDTPAE